MHAGCEDRVDCISAVEEACASQCRRSYHFVGEMVNTSAAHATCLVARLHD